jgi:hypothetical protein
VLIDGYLIKSDAQTALLAIFVPAGAPDTLKPVKVWAGGAERKLSIAFTGFKVVLQWGRDGQ